MKSNFFSCWDRFHVWGKNDQKSEDGDFFVTVYEIFCCRTNEQFYLISYRELFEFDDIKHCVCVIYNKLNLLEFYAKYLIPFSDKNFSN